MTVNPYRTQNCTLLTFWGQKWRQISQTEIENTGRKASILCNSSFVFFKCFIIHMLEDCKRSCTLSLFWGQFYMEKLYGELIMCIIMYDWPDNVFIADIWPVKAFILNMRAFSLEFHSKFGIFNIVTLSAVGIQPSVSWFGRKITDDELFPEGLKLLWSGSRNICLCCSHGFFAKVCDDKPKCSPKVPVCTSKIRSISWPFGNRFKVKDPL